MPLIRVREDWLLNTDNLVSALYDAGTRRLTLVYKPGEPSTPLFDDEADQVWEALRRHVVSDPEPLYMISR